MPPTPEWMDRRACGGLTPEASDAVFFPDRESRAAAEKADRLFCGRCPVWVECLDSAVATKSVGIFAGTETSTRSHIGRRRSRQKCPACLEHAVFRTKPPEGARVDELCMSCGLSWPAEDEPATGAQIVQLPIPRLRPAAPPPAGSGPPAATPPSIAMPA